MKQPLGVEHNIVRAWTFKSTLLELYHYTPCKPEKLPAHCHDDYQFCFSVNYPSEYIYRRAEHFLPAGSLSIMHPGEMHSGTGRDVGNGIGPITFRMMYIQPQVLVDILGNNFERVGNVPHFTQTIVLDSAIARSFSHFHALFQTNASQLEQDVQLQSFLTLLARKHADSQLVMKPLKPERKAVKKACDYMRSHYTENIGLVKLAQIVNLSPSYFSRVFKAEKGLSLPQYQAQLRIAAAKTRLLKGIPIKRVASDLGFVDQSHFTRSFKRFVQVTPGRYRLEDRKNMQDSLD